MLDSSLNVEKQYVCLNRLNMTNRYFKNLMIYLKIALVCKKYGSISKENYLKIWGEDNYESDINRFNLFYNSLSKDGNSDLFLGKL